MKQRKRKLIDAIFLDRDGVINEVVLRDGIVSSPRSLHELIVREEFIEFHHEVRKFPTRLFVVSNQPDISRKLFEQSVLTKIDERLQQFFAFDEIVYCTHDDDACCECRKPKPGMIISLLQKHRINPERAIFIGDSKKDVLAGQAAGVTTVFLRRPYNAGAVDAEFTVDSLREILNLVTFTEESQ
jgi:D-glycero-D-manno-heptose 1,7-bisphosphate phosphatase